MYAVLRMLNLCISNSLIAVHGLNGDRENTWRRDTADDAKTTTWLQTLGTMAASHTRIFSFGYTLDASEAPVGIRASIERAAFQLLQNLTRLRNGTEVRVQEPVTNDR